MHVQRRRPRRRRDDRARFVRRCVCNAAPAFSEGVSVAAPVRRVLLLDDEPSVLGVLADYLVAPGIEIVTCREIEAAEAILEHHRFDVVVTDLRVSELGGLEGIRLIRYVSTHFPETTVLAMSGYVNDDVHALGRAVGAVAVLEKPIDLRRLRRYVHGENGLPPPEAKDDPQGRVSEVDLRSEERRA